jgi:Acyclic terpene utilisation family protein AtuA
VTGARGDRRPDRLKATVLVASGVLGEAEISYAGPNALARARLAADIVTSRLRRRAPELEVRVDAIGLDSTLGALAHVPEKWKPVFREGHAPINESEASRAVSAPAEIRLRFAAQHQNREPVELLLDEVEALYCAGPAGGGGVRRHITPRLASASCLIERERVEPRVTFVGEAA